MVIDPAELYHLIEGQVKASVLIIDLRAKAQYKASHIESFGEFHLINISPTFLSHGCIGQMIEDKMPPRKKDAKQRFSNRNTYDFVVLIGPSADDWNEPPTECVPVPVPVTAAVHGRSSQLVCHTPFF
jgi:hypothetical protein